MKLQRAALVLVLAGAIAMADGSLASSPAPANDATSVSHETEADQELSLRISEPVNAVIADLESYIPDRMEEVGVPGLAIALIRGNQIVWTDGFGVACRFSSKPVSSSTVFEAASISKVVTAYTALRLVEMGQLSLDEPVHALLKRPWLPPSTHAEKITLRHLLSHSSGLGDDPVFRSMNIAFEPGSGFLYSGMGAEYIRELIEQVTDRPMEETAREVVFGPLGMSSSSFINDPGVMDTMANGHMRYLMPLLLFLYPFVLAAAITAPIALLLNRIIRKTWKTARQLKAGLLVLAFLLAEVLFYVTLGRAFPSLVWVRIACAVVFFCMLALLYVSIRRLMSYISRLHQKKALRASITIVWMIASAVLFLKAANSVVGPVPLNHSSEASAIGSLRASAPDLATLLIELDSPRFLSKNLAAQIDSPQTRINQDFSWGLGIGIQHTIHGDAIWQNAITLAFRGIMVMYPELGHGVVVLTNSEAGLPVAYGVAERALGGEAKWKYF